MKELAFKIDEAQNSRIIKNEVVKMNTRRDCGTFIQPERLLYSNQQVKNDLNDYLQHVRDLSIRREKKARYSRDSVISILGPSYAAFVNEYTNDQLNKLVLRKDQFDKIKSGENGRLVRDFEPVYQIPRVGDMLQGPFYGALKRLAGYYVPTVIANVVVIWSMTLLLIVILYFNGLIFLMQAPEAIWSRLRKSTLSLLS